MPAIPAIQIDLPGTTEPVFDTPGHSQIPEEMKMRTTAIAALLFPLTTSLGAITWEFGEDTQGWQIRLKSDSGSFFPPLDVVVEEGVLRIPITDQFLGSGRNPVLVSPQLNLDSGLFDRVGIRLRFLHPDPVATSVVLGWTNDRTPDV